MVVDKLWSSPAPLLRPRGPCVPRVPTENRLLWVDFVEIVWVTILSRQAADQARTAARQAQAESSEPGAKAQAFESGVMETSPAQSLPESSEAAAAAVVANGGAIVETS